MTYVFKKQTKYDAIVQLQRKSKKTKSKSDEKVCFSSWECQISYSANTIRMELGDSLLTLSWKQKSGNMVPGWYHLFLYIWTHVCQKYLMYFLICIQKYGYSFWHGNIWSCQCMMCSNYNKYTSGSRLHFCFDKWYCSLCATLHCLQSEMMYIPVYIAYIACSCLGSI